MGFFPAPDCRFPEKRRYSLVERILNDYLKKRRENSEQMTEKDLGLGGWGWGYLANCAYLWKNSGYPPAGYFMGLCSFSLHASEN